MTRIGLAPPVPPRPVRPEPPPPRPRGLLFLVVLGLSLGVGGAARAGVRKDTRLGYRITIPHGWREIPVKISEKWIVAKYVSPKEYFARDDVGWTVSFKPDLRVIVFPFSVTKGERVKETREKVGGGEVVFRELRNPYRDYKDYLKRTYSGGGWYISREEDKKKKDLSWTLLEIKVEKLARSGKKRLVAGVFHAEDADYVVQFELLEESYPKLKNSVYACLNSFRFLPREGSLAPETTGGPRRTEDESKLRPEERKKRREALQRVAFERAVSGLPKGWDHFEYRGRFLVLSHVDRRYAKMICRHGDRVWNWIDRHFDFLGDEYVRPVIVRICENPEEERAYHDSPGGWFLSSGAEVVLSKGEGRSFFGSPFAELNRRILSNYFRDKDPDLYWALPSWFQWGLDRLVGAAWTLKRGTLVFPEDTGQRAGVARARGRGEIRGIRALLTSSRSEVGASYSDQTGALVRFFLLGPGRRMKHGRDFLRRYLHAVKEYALERRKKEEAEAKKAEPRKEPQTEEEEEEEFRRRHQARRDWEKAEKEHLTAIFRRAFSDGTEATWKTLDTAFRSYLAGRR